MTNIFLGVIVVWIALGLLLIAGSALAASNFTSYTGDMTNSTAIIVWTGKYCNWSSTQSPTHIATECNKTYDIANNIISNTIDTEGKNVDKQGEHCKKTDQEADKIFVEFTWVF